MVIQSTSNVSLLYNHIEGFIANTFASAYWKDCDGNYLGINDVFVRVSGVHSHADVVGSTDRDQIWHEQADLMMTNDHTITETECVKTFLEKALHPDGHIVHYLSHKTPLRDRHGKVIGSFGLSYGFETQAWNQDRLNEVAMIVGTQGVEHVQRFLLTQQCVKHQLSARQADCLYYLTKGMTIKQIAETLSLSKRTVEHYLETVKVKLNCLSRSELVAKAFEINLSI